MWGEGAGWVLGPRDPHLPAALSGLHPALPASFVLSHSPLQGLGRPSPGL